jgi:hypothetical protein
MFDQQRRTYKEGVVMPTTITTRMYRFDQYGGHENLTMEAVRSPNPATERSGSKCR